MQNTVRKGCTILHLLFLYTYCNYCTVLHCAILYLYCTHTSTCTVFTAQYCKNTVLVESQAVFSPSRKPNADEEHSRPRSTFCLDWNQSHRGVCWVPRMYNRMCMWSRKVHKYCSAHNQPCYQPCQKTRCRGDLNFQFVRHCNVLSLTYHRYTHNNKTSKQQ